MQFKFYRVNSDSMFPVLKTGDIAGVIPSENYYPGDVVVFLREGYCVHRLYAVIPFTGFFLEKGDASGIVTLISVADIAGRVELPIVSERIDPYENILRVTKWLLKKSVTRIKRKLLP